MTKDQKHLLKLYLKVVQVVGGRSPSIVELEDAGLTRNSIRYHFGTREALDQAAREKHPKKFRDIPLATFEVVGDVQERRLIITTAAVGCQADIAFCKAIRKYADETQGQVLVLPCADPAARRSPNGEGRLDKAIYEHGFTVLPYQDLDLNKNLKILGIRVSAKQINPLYGLEEYGNRGQSMIVASPKQRLLYVATANKEGHPHALMSTGACTLPDYRSDMHRSHRTAYKAEADHVMGAIVVDLHAGDLFGFRHIEADEKGGFFDKGQRITPRSVKRVRPEAIVLGDWHSWVTSANTYEWAQANIYGAKKVFLHDSYDGVHPAVNHHVSKKPNMSIPWDAYPQRVEEEVSQWARDLVNLAETFEEIVIVPSNHDDRMVRWLEEGRFIKDPINAPFGAKMNAYLHQDKYPLQAYFEEYAERWDVKKGAVRFLKRDEGYKIGRCELGHHGDKGSNGAKGSLDGFNKSLGYCIIGHAHSAALHKRVMRVGHSCDMSMVDYVSGASSWTETHALVYEDGRAQLHNLIDGEEL